jgi:tetratricopeptide (TPR) repeat protein
LLCAQTLLAGPMDDGEANFIKGEYAAAIASYRKALEYDLSEQNRATCWYMLGLSYLMSGNAPQARKAFSTILSRYAKTDRLADAYVGLGDVCFFEKKYDEAIKHFKNSMAAKYLGQHGSSVYYRLARVYRAKGDSSKADYYEGVIQKQYPDSLEARLTLQSGSGTARPAAAGSSNSGAYAVQISYTTRADYAREYATKFKDKGYDAYVEIKSVKGARRYLVLVGKYSSYEAATAQMKKLKSKEKIDAFVTRVGG